MFSITRSNASLSKAWSWQACLHCMGMALVMAWGGLAHAQTSVGPNSQSAAFVLQQMALHAAISEMPKSVAAGLQEAIGKGMPMPPEVAQVIVEKTQSHSNWNQMQPKVLALLQQRLRTEHVDQWAKFYQSPLGQRMAQAERRGSSVEVMQKVMQRGPELMLQLSSDTSRMALMQSLVDASHSLDRATHASMTFALAMDWAIISSMPSNLDKPSFEQLEAEMAGQRFVVRSQMAQFVLAHAAFLYQDFSNTDLQSLLAQVNSAAGQAMYKGFGDAFDQLMRKQTLQLGADISSALQSQGT